LQFKVYYGSILHMERAPSESSHESENKNHEAQSEPHYEILYSPELRAKYLTLTDGLIKHLTDQKTEVAIFLDKSARPVAWMVNEMWDVLAPQDADGNLISKKPQIKFLNIDREQWGATLGRSEDKDGLINLDRLHPERLQELRDLYAPIAGVSQESDQTLLTNKNVMVIDEVKMSGDTLAMSEAIIKKAFPDAASVNGAYWMLDPAKRDPRSGALTGGEVPVWYSDETNKGRLVANRDSTKSSMSNSTRQRTGAYWLSTRFRNIDFSGRQLKQEVKWMVNDIRGHRLIYKPASGWDESTEDVDTRIQRINGLSIDEYVGLRREAKDDSELNSLYREYIEAREHSVH